MAFCKYCGKQLIENEVCECEKTRVNPSTNDETLKDIIHSSNDKKDSFQRDEINNFIEKLKKNGLQILKILKEPEKASIEFIEAYDKTDAAILIVFQAILSGLFALLITGKINSYLGILGSFMEDYKLNGANNFAVTLGLSILFSACFTVIVFGVSKLIKVDMKIEKAMLLASVRSVAMIPFSILAILIFLINPTLGLSIFYLSNFMALCFILSAYQNIAKDHKFVIYSVMGIFLAMFLVYAIVMSKAYVLYVPDSFRNLMNDGIYNLLNYM